LQNIFLAGSFFVPDLSAEVSSLVSVLVSACLSDLLSSGAAVEPVDAVPREDESAPALLDAGGRFGAAPVAVETLTVLITLTVLLTAWVTGVAD
jgi:hypothetical protein